jgi:hypothetical protein
VRCEVLAFIDQDSPPVGQYVLELADAAPKEAIT